MQGAEGLALAGATRLLRDFPPAYILVDITPTFLSRSRVKPRALLNILKLAGYRTLDNYLTMKTNPFGPKLLDEIDKFDENTHVRPCHWPCSAVTVTIRAQFPDCVCRCSVIRSSDSNLDGADAAALRCTLLASLRFFFCLLR